MNTRLLFFVLAALAGPFPAPSAPFSYQGVLTESGRPAESNFDLRFRIYGAANGTVLLAGPVYADNVATRAGHFVVSLDFGDAVFNGQPRWLEIAVRAAGSPGEYTTLAPRQLIGATPYAITALNVANAAPASLDEGVSSNLISGTILSPLRVQGTSSTAGEIRVSGDEITFSGDDSSSEHHGTRLLLQAGNAMGPDKNGGNIILVPGFATGSGRSGRVVVDGALKITGPLAATALIADGSGIINLSASNLTGVIGNQHLSGPYGNALQFINPANEFHGIFNGDGSGLSNITASVFTGVVPNAGLAGAYSNALELSNASNRVAGAFIGTFAGDGRGLSNVTATALKGVLPNAGLTGTYSQVLNLSNTANVVLGSFFGDGAGLANLQATQITGVIRSEHFSGTYSNALRFPNPANQISGTFAGNGAGVSNVNASTLAGLGSTDFAQRHSSNFFSAAQTFAAAVLFSNVVSAESDLQVRGAISAATFSGNGAGLANLSAAALTGTVPGGALNGTYANALSFPNSANSFQGNFAGDGSRVANVAASNITGVLASARLAGTYGNALQLTNAANQFQGTFSGNGAALTGLDAGALTGLLPDVIAGTYANAVDFPNPANSFRGSFVGDGLGLANIPFANLAGVLGNAQLQGTYTNRLQLNNPANEFSGDGPGLNNLNASALASGSVPDTRLSANVAKLNTSPVFAGSVTAQDDLFAARLSVGSIGINTTNPPGRSLLVNGLAGITSTNTLEFGANIAGKHANAGKIGYQTFTPGALDIVGAGTNLGSRRIKFWAEGGATFNAASTNPVVTLFNTVDEPTALSLVAPFRTWRIGQNKPPGSANIVDAFYIRDETENATRLLITDTGRVGLGTNNPAHPLHLASGAHCTAAGVWTSVSDRNTKEDFKAIDTRDVLAKVASLPIAEWKYKVEPKGTRHIGPTAQDFHAAFGLGESDKGIGTVDASGVALAAIQALSHEIKAKDREMTVLREKNSELEKRLELLEQRLNAKNN